MSESGAPTAKWPTLPPQLEQPGPPPSESRPRLLVRRPGLPEVEIPIEKDEFFIGRDAGAVDLALDDDRVSRRHARLLIDDRGYFKLEDLGSRNGLTFEGRPVRRLNLIDGDIFQIGRTEFQFHAHMTRIQKPSEATPRPAPPRTDSVFADVNVPTPMADFAAGGDDDDIGWNPEAARGSGIPDPAESSAPEHPLDDDDA